jgi:phage/plasmid-like protein (TIGR03299 family)
MAHGISKKDHAMYAITPAWHNLGTVLEEAPTSRKALIAAKMNWKVEKHPIYIKREKKIHASKFIEIPGKFANVRMDTGDCLGVVGKDYQVLQNNDAFKFMDGLVENEEIKYESAGSLYGGSVIWLLARMKKQYFITDDDSIQPYMLLFNSHNGTMMVRIQPTSVRVVCANTLTWAMRDDRSAFYIRHMGTMQDNIKEAKRMLGLLYNQHNTLNEILKDLSLTTVVKSKAKKFIEEMFPMPTIKADEDEKRRERIIERIHGVRSDVSNIFDNHPTTQTVAAKGTAYGLLNAYTYYIDHEKKSKGGDEVRHRSAMFGGGAKMKQQALNTARKIFGV